MCSFVFLLHTVADFVCKVTDLFSDKAHLELSA